MNSPSTNFRESRRTLFFAWLALVILTLVSISLGQAFHAASGLQLVVAGIVWLKGWVVIRCFLESEQVHPFIRRVLNGFILFAPLALVLTAFFGRQFAQWATL